MMRQEWEPLVPGSNEAEGLHAGLHARSCKPSHRVWFLFVLAVIAAGSVLAGAVAHSFVFWTAASAVFLFACVPLTLYASKRLGVLAEAKDALLQTVWRCRSGEPQDRP